MDNIEFYDADKKKIKIYINYNRSYFKKFHDFSQVFKTKPNSSIVKSIQLVKDNEADAIVSAGNTAALLSSALFVLGKILSGVENSASKWNNKGIDLPAEFAVFSLNQYGTSSQ